MIILIILIGDLLLRAFVSILIILFFNYFLELKIKGKRGFVFFFIIFLVVSATLPIIAAYWVPRLK